MGFLHGRGDLGGDGRARPRAGRPAPWSRPSGDTVVTWGSEDGAPYVAGVPVGRVTVRLRQPAGVLAARRDRALRRLLRARPRRGRGALRHPQRPRRGRGRREPAVSAATSAARARSSPGGAASRWCCRSPCFPHARLARRRARPGPPRRGGGRPARGAHVRAWCSASSPASLLDLAPPADHVAGRWALALVLVGYVAGRVRQRASRPAPARCLATVAALLLRRHRRSSPSPGCCSASRAGRRRGRGARASSAPCSCLDVLLTPLVLPPLEHVRARPRRPPGWPRGRA